ncbi:pyridoxal phosphate-dependent aminotransferase [Butyrivibrio sp. JL13D10]|uniref:pyridoxal phosphate-dependent aminotransferase n=1 Tax=Butyrivibrio sp. JL13D10 TaxID=3236815 RepID=UPI0038B5B825
MDMLHGGEIYELNIEYDFSVNLNPLPCPQDVISAIRCAGDKISLYPDTNQTEFRRAVAAAEGNGIMPSNIIGGNGASELLVSVLRYLDPRRVLIPVPSFYGYRHALNMLSSCMVEEYILREDNDYILDEEFIGRITHETDAVIIANPNNPTGRCISVEILDEIINKCKSAGTALIIDECFIRLSSGTSAIKYFRESGRFPNLFIINAYTKLFSIPGVRLGYAISNEKNIEGISKFLPEWNLSVFAENAGIACANILEKSTYEKDSAELIEDGRKRLSAAFEKKGIKVFPSETNFILIKTERKLYENLLEYGILIRDCENFRGLGKGFYRIAVKDKKSIDRLIQICSKL